MVAVLLGWAFAGEPVTGQTLLSAAVIVAGVALISTAPAKKAVIEEAAADQAPDPEDRTGEPPARERAAVLELCREEPEPALAER